MTLEGKLSIRIYIYNIAEKDRTTKTEYLLALAKDIYEMKTRVEVIRGNSLWELSKKDKEDAFRISDFYVSSIGESKIA